MDVFVMLQAMEREVNGEPKGIMFLRSSKIST